MNITKNNVFLLVLFALYFLIPLEFRYLWQPDESRYAEISREMLARGDWIVPRFFDLRYFEKPIAGYWINNFSQLVFGHNNFAVRFGSVFSVALTALIIFWLAEKIGSERKTAVMAAVIFLTSLLVYGIGSYAVLDPMLTLWLAAVMACHWLTVRVRTTRDKLLSWLLLGSACGMGFMTKGLLALVVPAVAILPWAVQQNRWRESFCYAPVALLGAVIITLPWGVAVARREPDFWHYFFWIEHVQRFAASNAQHRAPFWYYMGILIPGCLPWLALLPGALRCGWQGRKADSGNFWLFCWTVMPLLFFSIAKGKLPTYILPCFVPLAILMARQASQLMEQENSALRLNGWINLVVGLGCAVIVVGFLAPWGFAGYPLYTHNETLKVGLAAGIFLMWALVGLFTLRHASERWSLAALCPLTLALLVGMVVPDSIIDNQQPQRFVQQVAVRMTDSRYLLTNNPGTGSTMAWTLKRSDILFYKERGEMSYGLSYPDAQGKFIPASAFPDWLAQHRTTGKISLLLLLDDEDARPDSALPAADYTEQRGRLLLLQYNQQPVR